MIEIDIYVFNVIVFINFWWFENFMVYNGLFGIDSLGFFFYKYLILY